MTRWLLIVSALLAWIFAAALLFAARQFEAPVGIELTDKLATIAQAQGAILAGLGLINWLSRNVTDTRALTAVLTGNLVVQILSFAVAARAAEELKSVLSKVGPRWRAATVAHLGCYAHPVRRRRYGRGSWCGQRWDGRPQRLAKTARD